MFIIIGSVISSLILKVFSKDMSKGKGFSNFIKSSYWVGKVFNTRLTPRGFIFFLKFKMNSLKNIDDSISFIYGLEYKLNVALSSLLAMALISFREGEISLLSMDIKS